jgi:predicted metalloendopeptidase
MPHPTSAYLAPVRASHSLSMRITMHLVRPRAVASIAASIFVTGVAATLFSQDMDRSIKPGDDFYGYANGRWVTKVTTPRGLASYDTRAILTERTSQRVRDLIQEAAAASPDRSRVAQKVGDYYASLLDVDAIEAKGLAPLSRDLAAIDAISNTASLSAYLGATLNTEVDGLTANGDHLFGVFVNQGFEDSRRYLFHLLQGGLGMPDREAYLDPSPKAAALRAQYQAHIAAILRLANITSSGITSANTKASSSKASDSKAADSSAADSKAARILSLETRIAQSHAPDADAADVFKQNNPWTRADFDRKAPGMNWSAYVKAAGVDTQPEFVVWQPSAVTGAAALVGSEDVEAWKDYLRFHLIEHFAPVLPKAVGAEEFAFHGTILSGREQMPDRAGGAIAATSAALGQAVSQLYTPKYFPPEAKAKAHAMVADLITAYRPRLSRLTWMSPATKQKALDKLTTFRIGLGYPDTWIDYATLDVVRGDAFGNLTRAEAFNRAYNLAKLRRPADPDEWRIDPHTVSGIIMFSPNTETFSAGILQAPFFDANGDAASNYGSAGAGIAHEITHTFDELGNIYDDQGRLRRWWTAEDLTNYRAATAKLAAQLASDCPLPDACVNGTQVLTETVADLAGLQVAHDAYLLSLKGKPDVVIDGLTGEQRFFLAFAQRWRRVQSEASLRRQIATDTHLPPAPRSNNVRRVDAWYSAYGIAPGARLYLQPADRVSIW